MTFGKGLDFEIKILPWTAGEVYHDWVLISPPPVTSSPPVKRPGGAAAVGPIKNEAHQPPLRNITTSGPGSIKKKIVGTGRVADRAVGPHNPGLPASSSSMRKPYTADEPIGKTTRTLVFKATRKDTIVAIKVCRKPKVKESADTWRNEMEILSCLNHVSNIMELRFGLTL